MAAPNEGRNAIDAMYSLAESMSEMKVLLRSIANSNAQLLDLWRTTTAAESEAAPTQQQQQATPPPPPPATESKMDKMMLALIAPQLGLDVATLKGMSEDDIMTMAVAKMGTKKPVEAPANPPPTPPATPPT